MARKELEDAVMEEEGIEKEDLGTDENSPMSSWLTSQTPWWVISILFHGLAILLLGLLTMALTTVQHDDLIIVTNLAAKQDYTQQELPPVDSKHELEADHDTPATDPDSQVASDIVVPPDILRQAELGDHFETINLDRPDTQSAFGNPDAHMFHSIKGSDDDAGGGGTGGVTLDEVIGVGAGNSPGTGGGWGGGHGTGTGVDSGSGKGSFGNRNGGGRRLMVMRHGGSRHTENAVDASLKWLADHQEADGHWDCVKYGGKQADVAVAGLGLLAFLGAGHTEKVGKYKDNVARAISWLKSVQNADGSLYKNGETHGIGYHHSIAGLALAEAAGMARVPDTIRVAQKAVDYSIDIHQRGEASDRGGWRYAAKSAVCDISVSGWFIMQLKSAKVAGLKVDPASFEGAIKFLDSVENKNAQAGNAADSSFGGRGHVYGYTEPNGVNHRRTAIGCLGRQFLGWKKEDLQGGVQWFIDKGGLPSWGANGGSVDLYFWYYGTLCVFQQGGDVWNKWNDSMKKALTENQRRGGDENGSWDPVGEYSGYWGRAGQTALACLCLEVYYRYMPLYK